MLTSFTANFERYSEREKLALIAAAIAILSTLFFLFWLEPHWEQQDQITARIDRKTELLTWMKEQPVRNTPSALSESDPNLSLSALRQEITRQPGIIISSTPQDQTGIDLLLNQADFASTIRWLAQVTKRYPLKIQTMHLNTTSNSGKTSGTIRLEPL